MAAIETEIKFRVHVKEHLEAALEKLGLCCVTPRSFEANTLYDTPDRSLRARRELLRIRHYAGQWLMTHKRVPDSGVGEDRHKHRVETETTLSDGKALAEVFVSLGLEPVFFYEKYRTEWADPQPGFTAHCLLDETPLGVYAELEGPAEWIDRIAAQLGIAPEDQLTLSYGRLFDQWREKTGSQARDLTFEAVAAPSSDTSSGV